VEEGLNGGTLCRPLVSLADAWLVASPESVESGLSGSGIGGVDVLLAAGDT